MDWLRIDRSLQRILYATRRVEADISARSNPQGTAFADSPLLTSERDFSLGATLGRMCRQSERRVTPKSTSHGGELDTPPIGG